MLRALSGRSDAESLSMQHVYSIVAEHYAAYIV
jgi:hypothetical protein